MLQYSHIQSAYVCWRLHWDVEGTTSVKSFTELADVLLYIQPIINLSTLKVYFCDFFQYQNESFSVRKFLVDLISCFRINKIHRIRLCLEMYKIVTSWKRFAVNHVLLLLPKCHIFQDSRYRIHIQCISPEHIIAVFLSFTESEELTIHYPHSQWFLF